MVMVERDHHQYKNHSTKRSGEDVRPPLPTQVNTSKTAFWNAHDKLRDVPAHTGRDAERDLENKNFLAASLADLRMTLESRVRCELVKHHIHVLHDSPGDQVAAMEVRWVVRVLVRHPFRRGNNALPPSSRRRRRAGRFCPTP